MGLFDKLIGAIEQRANWEPCPECGGVEFRSDGPPRDTVACRACGYETDRDGALAGGEADVTTPGDHLALQNVDDERLEEAERIADRAEGSSVTAVELLKNRGFLGSAGRGAPVISHLDEDEQPHYLLKGNSVDVEGGGDSRSLFGNDRSRKVATGTSGVIAVVTDRRVLVIVPQLTGNDVRNVPYDSVTGIDMDSGIVNKRLTIQTHGRTYHVSGWFTAKSEVRDAMEYIRRRRDRIRTGTPETAREQTRDPLDALEKLRELAENGVITEAEFESKKRELLDEI